MKTPLFKTGIRDTKLLNTLISWLRNASRPIRYFDWLGPFYRLNRKLRPNSKIESLVLVDCFERTGGHFLWWMIWFGREFSGRFQRIVILVVDYDKTLSFITSEGINLPQNVVVQPFILKSKKTLCLTQIIRASALAQQETAVFFMWGGDLVGFSLIRERYVPWGVLGSVSNSYRENRGASDEARLREIVEKSLFCRLFVQPDPYINSRIPRSVWVPDIENVSLPSTQSAEFREIQKFIGESRSVGSFGFLTAERCVTKMIELSKLYPQIKFVLSGKLAKKHISPPDLDYINNGDSQNFLLFDRYCESEENFNELITSVDSVFIDGSNYPLQSGVIMKAIHFGKHVLTTEGNSWTQDFIEEHGVGHVLNERLEGLEDHWEEWAHEIGPQGNKAVSERLTSQILVRRQFDKMGAFLKGKSDE